MTIGGGRRMRKNAVPSCPYRVRSLAVAFGTPSTYRLGTGWRDSSVGPVSAAPRTRSKSITAICLRPVPPPRSATASRSATVKPSGVCVSVRSHRPRRMDGTRASWAGTILGSGGRCSGACGNNVNSRDGIRGTENAGADDSRIRARAPRLPSPPHRRQAVSEAGAAAFARRSRRSPTC